MNYKVSSIPLFDKQAKRLAISSKGKGKSGGARVITYLKVTATTVYLSAIYDKSIKNTISDIELEQIFKSIP